MIFGSKKRLPAATILACGAALAAGTARADFIWNGSGETDLWIDGDNWNGGVAPDLDLGSTGLIFGPTGAAQSPNAGFSAFTNVGSIAFTGADAELTLIGNGSLSMVDGATITNDSTFKQTINIGLIANGTSLVLDAAAGDLTIGGFINLTDPAGVVLSVLGDNSTGISGNIFGVDSSLLKQGTGVLTLSGFNSYGGGTELAAGIILLGNNSALGTGELHVTGDSGLRSNNEFRTFSNDISIDSAVTLTFSGSENLRHFGVISGDGTLAMNAVEFSSLLTLFGDNTYTGGTTISKGTIVLGNDNALGTGTLTLTGNGALQSSDDTREITNLIDTAGHILIFKGVNTLTLAGVISGTGGLRISGDGSLILSADNTYTGDSNINSGELVITGSIAGLVNVNDGGTLSGDGSMGGDLTNFSGGTASPGDGVGTFTVDGNYDQQAGSTMSVELNADDGTSDLLDVGLTATLAAGSTIQTSFAGDNYITAGQTITILQAAGGITDNGAQVTIDSATVQWIVDPTFVDGNTSYALEMVRAANAYSAAADPGNNRQIGLALNELIAIADSAPLGNAADLLGQLDALAAADYNTAVTQLSPEPYNTVTAMALDNAQAFTSQQATYLATRRGAIEAWASDLHNNTPRPGSLAMAQDNNVLFASALAEMQRDDPRRLPPPALQSRWRTYAKVQGIFSDQEASTNRTGFDANSFGGQVGVDYSMTEELTAGLALSYAATNANLHSQLGEIDDQSIRSGPYMSLTRGDWYLDGSVTFAYHFYNAQRNIPQLNRVADSDHNAYEVTGYLGSGYHFEVDRNLHLTPMASVQYSYFNFDSFTETGAGGASLTVGDRVTDSLRSRIGASLSYKVDWGAKLLPYVYAGWEHEFFDEDNVEASFVVGGNPFTIDTGNRETDSVFFGGGVSLLLDYNISAFLRYEASMAPDGDVLGVAGGVSVTF